MELHRYVRVIRRSLWLIIIAVVVGGGYTFVTNVNQPPVYTAQVTLLVGQYIESPNPNMAEISVGINLASTYVQLLETRPVLEGTIDALNLDLPPDYLRGIISARMVTSTSLIIVSVVYTDPVLAADIANALAEEVINQSPTNLTLEQQNQITFLNNQIEILNVQVQDLQGRLVQISSELESTSDPTEVAVLNQERDTALEQLNLAQANIGQFSSTIAQLQQRVNSVQIVERAIPPLGPTGGFRITSVILGAAVAGIAAIGLVFLLEYFDDTIRTTEDASQMLALPVLGAIIRYGKRGIAHKDMRLTKFPPMSSINEGYRSVRTNILYTLEKGTTGVIVITSANPQEGKSITVSNLAISMAMSGMRILLLDADLRRPKLHEVFGLDNTVGLTTLLFCDPYATNAEGGDDQGQADGLPDAFYKCIQPSGINDLSILTSGFIPANPTELLASPLMARWIEVIRQQGIFDIILIDSPPALAAADASVLVTNIDAKVIIVIDRGSTRVGAAKRVKDQFAQLDKQITGVIMNRIDPADENYGFYYGYYYTAEGTQPQPRGLQALFRRRR